MSESQQAMVAAKLANMQSQDTLKKGLKVPENPAVRIPTTGTPKDSQAKAARDLNVSRDSVNQAKRIQQEGISELTKAVEDGDVSVNSAAEVAKLPKIETVHPEGQSVAIEELTRLVLPPTSPSEVGTLADWRKLETRLGVKLPADYRAFVFAYGSGLFAGLYRVYNPFAASEYTNLLSSADRVFGYNRESQRSDPKRFPYPYFPDHGGLLPWGNDENGNDYFWLTKGAPAKWVVVQDNNRGNGITVQPFSMTGFLVAVLEKRVKALASGYPRKSHFKFESWGT